ncbi:unnamed protein product [Parascedosporium putredinis]|uniref:Uncharacterized protein n=1 Tax=Parascedosporium putredinis TaxID=1442378 RepID=A0A9P1MAW8_9PEZI|nr:unnamed protein product [Parascedosporium putredinis]CAI7998430.1 unnamed protein product [Parascedosporium putredinis]
MFASGNSGTFSPASCPISWYTVDRPDKTDTVPQSGKTTRTCCSKQYTLNGDFCERSIPTILATPVQYVSSLQTYSYMPHITYLVNATIAHRPVVVLFEQKDQEVLGFTDDDEHIADPGVSSSSSSSSSKSPADRLPLGAKIGIGVGTALVLSALLGFLFWFLRRSSRRPAKVYPHNRHRASAGPSGTADPEVAEARLRARRDLDPRPRTNLLRVAPDEELKVLKAQQEAIRRRIEQLERSGSADSIPR